MDSNQFESSDFWVTGDWCQSFICHSSTVICLKCESHLSNPTCNTFTWKKQSSHWPSDPLFSQHTLATLDLAMAAVPSTSAQKLWCLARMEIASAGVVGHNPEIARRKPSDLLMVPYVVRLACLKDEIEIPTSWRSTVPLLSFFWEKAFPTHSKSVISTAQLARLNWTSIYCPPVAWGKYDQVSRKSTSEFPNQPLVLVGGLVSKQKLQNTFFFRYSVDGKKSAPVDMVNI